MKKVDWDLANYGSRFKQSQGHIKATLDSAGRESIANKAEIALQKYGADLRADAVRMLKPDKAPSIPAPLALPTPTYTDPMSPTKPPAPVMGAKADTGGIANAATSVLSGVVSGAVVASATAGMTSLGALAGGPLGAIVGVGTALFS